MSYKPKRESTYRAKQTKVPPVSTKKIAKAIKPDRVEVEAQILPYPSLKLKAVKELTKRRRRKGRMLTYSRGYYSAETGRRLG